MRVLDHRTIGRRQDDARARAVAAAACRRSFRHFPRRRHAARGDCRGSGPQPRQPAPLRDAQCASMPDARRARAAMSSAPPSRCFTKCSAGTARTFPATARSTCACRWTSCSAATPRASTPRRNAASSPTWSGSTWPAELPEAPDLILDNFGALDSAAAVERIWSECVGPAHSLRSAPAGPVRFGDQGGDARGARAAPAKRAGAAADPLLGRRNGAPIAGACSPRSQAERWGTKPVIVRSSCAERGWRGRVRRRENTIRCSVCVGEQRLMRRRSGRSSPRSARAAARTTRSSCSPCSSASRWRASPSRAAERRRPLLCRQLRRSLRPHRSRSPPAPATISRPSSACSSRTDACPAALAPVDRADGRARELLRLRCASTWNSPIDGDGQLYLLQVRQPGGRAPGHGRRRARSSDALADVARKVELLSRPHPFLHGSRSIFGVMPDWNPAEIIGLRPWPLSLSLYRELDHRRHLGLSARQLRLPEPAQLPAAGELSRAALYRRARELQLLRAARRAERSRRAAGQLLHRPPARRAAAARQGRIRDHLFVLHAGSAAAAGAALGERLFRTRTSPSSPARCAA